VILSQVGITYRGSPLARDLDDTTDIRAGDRAPDTPCILATSGEKVRLFDLFRGDAQILVRPDGYIGLTGGSIDPQPTIDYLRDVTSR